VAHLTVNEMIEALLKVRDVYEGGELPVTLIIYEEQPSSLPMLSGYALEHVELRTLAGYKQCLLGDRHSLAKFDMAQQTVRN
jgi:hypothetical protein